MNSFRFGVVAALAAAYSVSVMAQTPLAVGGAPLPVLRAGTAIPMKNSSDLTTKGKQLKVANAYRWKSPKMFGLTGRL